MPCANIDLPSMAGGRQPQLEVPPESVYYRPLYSINGVDQRVDWWVERDGNAVNPDEVDVVLNLAEAIDTPWASLGFPDLDQDPSYGINSSSSSLSDVEVSLRIAGMHAFDVDRGLWYAALYMEMQGTNLLASFLTPSQ
jgi:hypothetical protein